MIMKRFIVVGLTVLLVAVFQAMPQATSAQSNAPAAAPKAEVKAVEVKTEVQEDGTGMVLIPAGGFWMGRTQMFLFDELNWTARARQDDQPVRMITLDGFYIDKYEVTTTDYATFADATNRKKPWYWKGGKVNPGQEKWPVYDVNWEDATAYCAWAGKRLPTEAEWEKAARGGLERNLYSWGNELDVKTQAYGEQQPEAAKKVMAHYQGANGPLPVGSFPPNGYGLYDVTGNVWEWVSDWYGQNYYSVGPLKNPTGPSTGTYKVIRGGGWTNDEDLWNTGQRSLLGVHYRNYAPATQISDAYGFRCAKDAK